MKITDYLMLFCLRDNGEVYDFERMQRLLQALAAKGYYISAVAEDEKVWPLWNEWTAASAEAPSPMQAGVSPQAWSEVKQFCTEKQESLQLLGYSVANQLYGKNGKKLFSGFGWSLGFDEDEGVVYIAYLRHHFTFLLDEGEYTYWLGIIQSVYNIWHPIYGYTTDGEERTAPREEIVARKISYLYDINLFGPEIVEALGRERVESTPAQIVTPLDDGGVMLVPCENLLPGFTQYSYAQVAQHLGLTPGRSKGTSNQ